MVLDDELIKVLHVPEEFLNEEINIQKREVSRRYKAYREDLPLRKVKGRDVILVDDGTATGATMTAAIRSLRKKEPRSIILAVPVAPQEIIMRMKTKLTMSYAFMSRRYFMQWASFTLILDRIQMKK